MTNRNHARKPGTYFEQLPVREVMKKIGDRSGALIDSWSRSPTDGDTRPCPQCRETLVFNSRYPVMRVGAIFQSSASPRDRIQHKPAWVCRNGACDYREVLGDI